MVLRQTIKMKEMQINKTMIMLIILLFMFGMKVSADNIQVPNADNVLIYYNWGNEDKTELSVTFRGKYVDDFKDEYVGDIVIPETVDYGGKTYKVTSIGDDAFCSNAKVTSVTIPKTVKSIGGYAFWECSSLTSITLPEGITHIGKAAFHTCSSLTSVKMLCSPSYDDYIFDNCYLIKEVSFDCETVVSLFSSLKTLETVHLSDRVTAISDYAFGGCTALKSITLPEHLTTIGYMAFGSCESLKSINIPQSVKTIEGRAFEGCGITSITIPGNGETTIGYQAFGECYYIKSIHIGDGVKTIGNNAFYRCDQAKTLVIGNHVTNIGAQAFAYCDFETVTMGSGVKFVGQGAFISWHELNTLRISLYHSVL